MLTGSHSNSFVRGVYDECLRIMDKNGDYLWQDVFPDVKVSNTNAKDCRIDLDKRQRFETLEFTSIGTGNAGLYRAATFSICVARGVMAVATRLHCSAKESRSVFLRDSVTVSI